jgi:hypothetical protein
MLQLAPAAFGEVTAWRHLVVRARRQRAVVEQHVAGHREGACARSRDPVAARGDADDRLAHRSASARDRGDEVVGDHPGPAISAARPCSHTRGAGRLERRHAARPQGRDHPGEHVAGPALASQAGAGGAKPSGRRATRPACPAPCRRPPRPTAAPPPARARPCCPRARRTACELALVRGEDRVMADEPLGLADQADRVGVDHDRARRSAPASAPAGCRPCPGPTSIAADARVVDLAVSVWTIAEGRLSIGARC